MGKFSNLSLKEKREYLLKHNGELSHRERVGLLSELLIEGKANADSFLKATGGMKSIYPEIAQMLTRFPLLFLVDFFDGEEIPFRPEADWKRYLWGAAWKSYREWSAQKAEEEHLQRKMEEEPMAFIHRYIAESGGKWKSKSY